MRNALLTIALLGAVAIALMLWPRPPEVRPTANEPLPPAAAPTAPAPQAVTPAAPTPEAPAANAPANDEAQRASEIIELVQQGKIGHARALADQFYRAYPHSPRIAEIERLTGYHPRPYGP